MSFGSVSGWWGTAVIVAVPIVVLLFGELAERLRQHGSAFVRVVAVTRMWLLPLATAYVLSLAVLGSDPSSPFNRVLASLLVLVAGAVVIMVIRVMVASVRSRAAAQRRDAPPQLLLALPRVLVVVVAFWVLFGVVWGVELSQTIAALGVSSLIVSLALQQPLGALASGLLLLGDQPFRTGDWIQIGDDEGKVIDVNWRTTRLRTRGGDLLAFPNSKLADATIINYTQPTSLHRISQQVQLDFSNPPARAIEMLLAAARDTPWVLTEPPPDVLVRQVDDPLMGYEVRVWIADRRFAPRTRSALAVRIWYASHRMGVPLPSPAQDLYLWDGPATEASKRVPPGELRRRLLASPWLSGLEEVDLDVLTAASRLEPFAPGETIMEIDTVMSADDAVRVLCAGRASVVATIGGDDTAHVVADVAVGDLITSMRGEGIDGVSRRLVATDACEVVVISAAAAEVVIGRNTALADSVERSARVRRHRLERFLANLADRSAP